jgi:site-specific DNA-methyltransferase (adenine-specific)/modification methylase
MINKIFNEDNLSTMSRMSDKSISGIICSPPYNICSKRKDVYYNNGYSDSDNLSEEEYLEVRTNEFKEFSRIIDDRGVICYNISYHNENPILPTLLMTKIHQDTDLTVADIITWKKSNAIPFQTSPTKLSRLCELVYVIVKKNHLHDFITNKEISKINEKTKQKFYKNYTNLIEAKNNDGIKTKLKASYSEDLVLKLINIYFPKNSLIYDPFIGIGTTARACKKSNRKFIGSELDKEHYDTAISLI